jgi:hypothetical protein
VGTEGGSTGAALVGTGRTARPPEPAVAKFVFRRRFSHLFRVGREGFVRFSLVQLLSVHVAVRFYVASFHRAIHSQGEMPRVEVLLGVHGEKIRITL